MGSDIEACEENHPVLEHRRQRPRYDNKQVMIGISVDSIAVFSWVIVVSETMFIRAGTTEPCWLIEEISQRSLAGLSDKNAPSVTV
jgi:hypothetical protein